MTSSWILKGIQSTLSSLGIQTPKRFDEYFEIMLENSYSLYGILLTLSFTTAFIAWFYSVKEDMIDKTETSTQEDDGKALDESKEFLNNEDLKQPSVISRVKIAQQKAIDKKVEESMTKEDLENEMKIQQDQLSKIYGLLKENKETFGDVSMEEIHNQMSLYKT